MSIGQHGVYSTLGSGGKTHFRSPSSLSRDFAQAVKHDHTDMHSGDAGKHNIQPSLLIPHTDFKEYAEQSSLFSQRRQELESWSPFLRKHDSARVRPVPCPDEPPDGIC